MSNLPAVIEEYEEFDEHLPPELILDKYHPHNTEYFKQLQSIKRLIVAHVAQMRPNHVEVVKHIIKGTAHTEIARLFGLTPSTVSNIKGREDSVKLRALFSHLSALNEGPTIEHRKRMLTEIAMDNQKSDPKVSISAVQEMNRMDGVGQQKVDPQINITINNEQLPRGALDG